MKNLRSPDQTVLDKHVPLCAVGASQGDVSALRALLQQLPDDLGVAFLVVLQRAPEPSVSPDHPAALAESLSAATTMPVQQIDGAPRLRPNCVYVVPPDRELAITGDTIIARDRTAPRGKQAPIDIFFRSAAQARAEGKAVVLTGAGLGSASGLRAIREAAGKAQSDDQALIIFIDADAAPADTTDPRTQLHPVKEAHRANPEEPSTAKDDLHAQNEALKAANARLTSKLESMTNAHSDLRTLITAIDIGTLFLDTDLRIRMFTPPISELFTITEMDTGRAITDVTSRLVYDGLEEDARKVLRDLVPVETEVRCRNGRWYLIRLRPYRTAGDRTEGVVLSSVDISSRRRIESDLRESQHNYQILFDSIDEGFAIIEMVFKDGVAVDYRFIRVNSAFERQTGLSDAAGQMVRTLVPDLEPHWFERYGRVASTGQPERFEAPSEVLGRYFDVYAFPVGRSRGNRVGLLFRDVSERKDAEKQRQLLTDELSHRVKNTLAVVQALARQPGSSQMTVEQYRDRFVGRIQALGHAHDQLLETHWKSADLETLARKSLSAYGGHGRRKLKIGGPKVLLTPKQGLGLALVLHELATNASKYGSLSVMDGALSLTWWLERDKDGCDLHLLWKETDGPGVKTTCKEGFGTRLIKQACSYELDGTVELFPYPEGYTAQISFAIG